MKNTLKRTLVALLIPGIMACAVNKQLFRKADGESPDSIVAGWTSAQDLLEPVEDALEKHHGGLYTWGSKRDCDGDGVNEFKWLQGGDGTVFYLKNYNSKNTNIWYKVKK